MTTIPISLGPRASERGLGADWTLVGPLDSDGPARVDGGGLITPHGADWSLDWWIGADDRWYFPSREAAVRQHRLGPGPVLQTSVRIPSGDAHHRVYGAMVGGREVTVVEVENDSPVPVALAMAIRPYPLDGPTAVADQAGLPSAPWPRPLRLAAPLVTMDGAAILRLPRPPNEAAAASDIDLADAVEAGHDLVWTGGVTTDATNAVFLYPLPHRTTLRFVLPVVAGADHDADGPEPPRPEPAATPPVPDPAAVPPHEAVSRGWTSLVEGVTRLEFPDPGLTRLVGAARARLLLSGGSGLVEAACALAPGAGSVVQALALGGQRSELVPVLEALADRFPTRLDGDPMAAAEVVAALGPTLRAVGAEPEPELVEVAAQLTHLVDRSGDRAAVAVARRGLAAVARAAGDHRGAEQLEKQGAGGHRRRGGFGTETDPAGGRDGGPTLATVMEQAALASEAGSWSGDSAPAAARFVVDARMLLVDDGGEELLLLPEFPTAWRGGNAEVHRAPTAHGELSFGIRWHGARPALLWQLDGPGAVIRCPSLDPDWHTTAARGDALLAGSAEGLAEPPGPGTGFR